MICFHCKEYLGISGYCLQKYTTSEGCGKPRQPSSLSGQGKLLSKGLQIPWGL